MAASPRDIYKLDFARRCPTCVALKTAQIRPDLMTHAMRVEAVLCWARSLVRKS